MNKWKFTVIDNWQDIWLDANVSRWTALMEQSTSSHVFFHPALVKAWVETYMPIRKLKPIFLWMNDDSGNEGVFPLVLWHKNWKSAFMKSIVPMGYSDFDYHDPIFRHTLTDFPTFWNQLICFLKSKYHFDEICIDGISEEMLSGTATTF